MKKTHVSSIVISLLLIAILTLGGWLYLRSSIIAVYEYPTDVTITETQNIVGIGIRKGEVHFGELRANESSRSGLVAYNFMNQSVRVTIHPRTNFTEWMEFTTPTDFILAPHERQDVNITVITPPWATPGVYSGTILVVFKKP